LPADRPTRLEDLARVIRSKNAGPYVLTLDILFDDEKDFDRALRSGTLTPEAIAARYGRRPGEVEVHVFAPAQAVKVSMPREHPSGSVADADLYGAQQHVLLYDIAIP
jgi:hypothetical protein